MKLTIIIPAHNEEKRIGHALQSIARQDLTDPFEVIVVDDGSQDKTTEVAEKFTAKIASLRVIRFEKNHGKGHCVRMAYSQAKGAYVHILDADDFFTSDVKLRKQIEILDSRPDFFATGHNCLRIQEDRTLAFINRMDKAADFSYEHIKTKGFYCHTSTLMFRRLPEGLPECFETVKGLRGDTAFFFYHAFKSKANFRYTPDIWSVYNYHGQGIWSGLSDNDRKKLQIEVLSAIREHIVQQADLPEYKVLTDRIDSTKRKSFKNTHQIIRINDYLQNLEMICKRVDEEPLRTHAFMGMNAIKFVDQACEAIGRNLVIKADWFGNHQPIQKNRILLLVSGLVPGGGGIFRELSELIDIFRSANHEVHLYSSSCSGDAQKAFQEHLAHKQVTFWQADPSLSLEDRLTSLLRKIHQCAAERIYPFIGHHDVVLTAAIQPDLGGQIILDYVYDHGTSLGIHASAITHVIVKTESQARALTPIVSEGKFILIPPFLADKNHEKKYSPLSNQKLTTASAAARAYKVTSEYSLSYADIIPELLKHTGGQHFHYGPLPPEFRHRLLSKMAAIGVPPEKLVYIDWAPDLGGDLLARGIDVFIAPFPVCSARIAVEVMSCGIPIVNHINSAPSMPQGQDFCDKNQGAWRTPDELLKWLTELDASKLHQLSESARKYYEETNEHQVSSERILQNRGIEINWEHEDGYKIADLTNSPHLRYQNSNHDGLLEIFMEKKKKNAMSRLWKRIKDRRKKFFRELRGR